MKKKSIAKAKTTKTVRRKASIETVTPDFELTPARKRQIKQLAQHVADVVNRDNTKKPVKKTSRLKTISNIFKKFDVVKEKLKNYVRKKASLRNLKFLPASATKGWSFLVALNRDVKPSHVTNIATSIDYLGCLRPVVIATFEYMGKISKYVIDGQNTYMACLRLNIEVPYIEIEINDDEELVKVLGMLNNSSKSWRLVDYVQTFAYTKPSYVKLRKYYEQYDFELSQLACILMLGTIPGSKTSGGNSRMSSIIKNGNFVVNSERKAIETLSCITDALKIVKRGDRQANTTFIGAYVEYRNFQIAEEKYNHSRFLAKLEKNKHLFQLATNDRMTMLEVLKSMK
jgi:hypothetical protein